MTSHKSGYVPRPQPTEIPTALWNDAPLFCLQLNDQWVSHLLGVMTALDQPDTWLGTEDDIYAARQQVNEIMLSLMTQCTPSPISLWDDSTTPGSFAADTALELGIKFKTTVPGHITGLRFYKDPAASGLHRGRLWADDGTLLGDLEYNTESASGWQNGYFNNPIAIDADTVYVASYFAVDGHFAYDWYYFNTALDRTPLIAPAAADVTVGNGVYFYGDLGGFPDQTNANNTNYWADVIFEPSP